MKTDYLTSEPRCQFVSVTASILAIVWILVLLAISESRAEAVADRSSCKITKVTKLSRDFPPRYRRAFDRYVQVIAPNGKPINIFAQKEISDSQLRHVRDVLVHYLTNVPGSQYGASKETVADRMATNHAMIMILKGSDGRYPEPRIPAQSLFETETVVEGSRAYMTNDFEKHRDATLEEILHCVHDNGIGVDIRHAPKGVLPKFQNEIRRATTHAMENKIWPAVTAPDDVGDWIGELREEGSLTQEYLASVIDSYYGLWGSFDQNVGMWGIYIARTRQDIQAKDPQGYALMAKFFPPYLSYMAEVDPSLKGTFSLSFDPKQAYTHKSRYLIHASLTGNNNANLTGNDQDNRLSGNAGDNIINGRKGNDTVVYPRAKTQYTITKNADGTLSVTGDGVDTLVSIEHLEFDSKRKEEDRFVAPVPPNLRIE